VQSFLRALIPMLVAGVSAGCLGMDRAGSLPKKTAIRSQSLHVLTDNRLAKDHELLVDLNRLKKEVTNQLELPEAQQQVVVYLFGDEKRYRDYLAKEYPTLPPRRAYFVGTSKELAVYTYWGDRIQEDLRHEYTHGVLHAALKEVPLWLDEGLAEYYELKGPPGQVNREYVARLGQQLSQGWSPRIERLETLLTVDQMRREDYRESWAWVHFMLHSSDATRDVLVAYLRDLRTESQPVLLSARLRNEVPGMEARFASYVGSLGSIPVALSEAK
jgi:hypothetical protein